MELFARDKERYYNRYDWDVKLPHHITSLMSPGYEPSAEASTLHDIFGAGLNS